MELNFVTREFRTSNNPTIDMLNMIQDYVDNEDQFTRKTAIPHDKFLDLVNLVLKTPWWTFNSKFYQQIDGAKMGGPASSTTAKIFVQAYEQNHSPKFRRQFVDGVFFMLKRTHLENLISHQQSSTKH